MTISSGGSQISTGREDFAGSSAVFPMLSEGLEIELSHFEAENTMLQGDYLWQVVVNVIRGVLTVLEGGFRCLFMSLSRTLLQGSVVMNVFDPIRHQLHPQTVEDSIYLLHNICLVADISLPAIHFAPPLAQRPSLSIWFLVYLLPLHKFISKMHFSHWEPPAVSERRPSVNLEASTAGENQTLGGHSGRPLE